MPQALRMRAESATKLTLPPLTFKPFHCSNTRQKTNGQLKVKPEARTDVNLFVAALPAVFISIHPRLKSPKGFTERAAELPERGRTALGHLFRRTREW